VLGLLELRGLVKRYGQVVALDDLSFTVPAGQMFGFVGTNGAGKTTAMRIVLGVLEPDAGEVRWQGHLTGADDRRRFGYMPEERGLYPKMAGGRPARLPGSPARGGARGGRVGGELDPLLRTAQSLGAVREFTPVTPTLVELFREVVTDPEAAETQAA
jgi:energy-coupling factor transporter ATP-binding protein EcfA2